MPRSSAEERFAELSALMPGQVELLHGEMTSAQKNISMARFSSPDSGGCILVSTTVIEVGVNVPDASICVIERAERFGLSALHQIRGRIGRGDPPLSETLKNCYCVLLHSDSLKKEDPEHNEYNGLDKLEMLVTSNDGFEIAEFDWRLRKGGDVFGLTQHGSRSNKVFSVSDHAHLFKQAKTTAAALIKGEYGVGGIGLDNEGLQLSRALFAATTSDITVDSSSVIEKRGVSKRRDVTVAPSSPIVSNLNINKSSYSPDEPQLFDMKTNIDLAAYAIVIIDLETTGLCRVKNRVIQIAAKEITSDALPLCQYVKPVDDTVSMFIEQLTGISQDFLDSEGVSINAALEEFLLWLRQLNRPVILLAHNGRRFDFPFIAAEFSRAGITDWIEEGNIFGMMDSLIVFKKEALWRQAGKLAPPSLSQTTLYSHITGKEAINAHNAVADVFALEEILEHDTIRPYWRSVGGSTLFQLKYPTIKF
jgi:DNA polymerase III epsilon subunit-like protein